MRPLARLKPLAPLRPLRPLVARPRPAPAPAPIPPLTATPGRTWAQMHSGYWPRYQTAGRRRTLAYLDSGARRLRTEDGVSYEVKSYADVLDYAVSERADLYVGSVLDAELWPYLHDTLSDERATVLCSRTGAVVGVAWKVGQRSVWLANTDAWSVPQPSDLFLHTLRRLFAYVGVGTFATPAALGEAVWRQTRAEEHLICPSLACARDLRVYGIGGRADTPGLGASVAELYEQDMRSAYAYLARSVPAGTAMSLTGECAAGSGVVLGFHQCVVSIPSELDAPFGPFPVRRLDSGLVSYPTRPGTYGEDGHLWLGTPEIADARAVGIEVEVGRGWGWPAMDHGNSEWVTRMTELRYHAPSPQIGQWVKTATVAAIGRHNAQARYILLLDDDPRRTEEDAPVCLKYGDAPIVGIWCHRVDNPMSPDERRYLLPHWFWYIVMQGRRTLYHRALQEHRLGNIVLSTNFDALTTLYPSRQPTSNEDIPGVWRETVLHGVPGEPTIPAARSLVTLEKQRRPGVRREAEG